MAGFQDHDMATVFDEGEGGAVGSAPFGLHGSDPHQRALVREVADVADERLAGDVCGGGGADLGRAACCAEADAEGMARGQGRGDAAGRTRASWSRRGRPARNCRSCPARGPERCRVSGGRGPRKPGTCVVGAPDNSDNLGPVKAPGEGQDRIGDDPALWHQKPEPDRRPPQRVRPRAHGAPARPGLPRCADRAAGPATRPPSGSAAAVPPPPRLIRPPLPTAVWSASWWPVRSLLSRRQPDPGLPDKARKPRFGHLFLGSQPAEAPGPGHTDAFQLGAHTATALSHQADGDLLFGDGDSMVSVSRHDT